jgi:hypothetical protein
MVIRVQPGNAAYIIARFGSVANLIDQIVHPLIDSSFRNKAGEKKAIDFSKGRQISSEACGFQLLLLIPIKTNGRAERAF